MFCSDEEFTRVECSEESDAELPVIKRDGVACHSFDPIELARLQLSPNPKTGPNLMMSWARLMLSGSRKLFIISQ